MPMTTNDALAMIAVSDIRPHCKDIEGTEERVRRAMERAQEFWLSTDDSVRFRAALAAALLETTDPVEKALIERSTQLAKSVSAMLSGVTVDLSDFEDTKDLLPLVGMWHEAKGKAQ